MAHLIRSLFLGIFFLCLNSYAQVSVHGFCFDRSVSLQEVKKQIAVLLKKDETVDFRNSLHCLEMNLSPARKDLFERVISKKFHISRIYQENSSGLQNSNQLTGPTINCHFELVTVSSGNTQGRRAGVEINNKFKVLAHDSSSQEDSKSSQNLLVGVGRSSTLSIDDQNLSLTCDSLSAQGANVTLSFTSASGGLSNSIFIMKGGNVEIGSIVDSQKHTAHSIGTVPRQEINHSKSNRHKKYFLYLK